MALENIAIEYHSRGTNFYYRLAHLEIRPSETTELTRRMESFSQTATDFARCRRVGLGCNKFDFMKSCHDTFALDECDARKPVSWLTTTPTVSQLENVVPW